MSKFDWVWSGLERGLNATFAWPQQMGLRALRVYQDEDVGFFDEEGFMDLGALPLVGLLDPAPKYVQSRETFDRTFGALGMEHGAGAEFAANVLTDPTFFMGGGLTKIGKAARTTENARRSWAVTKVLGPSSQNASVGKMKEVMTKALADKATKWRERRWMSKALDALNKSGVSDDLTVQGLLRQSAQRELRLSLPVLNHFGFGIRVAPGYDSWIKLTTDKVAKPGGRVLAMALGATTSRMGIVGKGLHESVEVARSFGGGFASRGEGLRRVNPAILEEGKEVGAQLTADNRSLYKFLFRGKEHIAGRLAKFSALQQKGMDPVKAARKAFGKKWGGVLPETVGSFDAGEIRAWADDFKTKYDDAVAYWNSAEEVALTDEVLKATLQSKSDAALKAFKVGAALGREFDKTFVSDLGVKDLRKAETRFRTKSAEYQRLVEEVSRTVLVPKLAAWAEAQGLDVAQAEKIAGYAAQMTALPEELNHFYELAAINGLDRSAAMALQHYAARFTRSAEQMQRFAQNGSNNKMLRQLARQVGDEMTTPGGLDNKRIEALFDGDAVATTREQVDAAKFIEDEQSGYILTTGPKALKGRALQFLSNKQLAERAGVIKRRKKPTADDLADLKAIALVLERRNLGRSKYVKQPAKTKVTHTTLPERPVIGTLLTDRPRIDEDGEKLLGEVADTGAVLRTAMNLRKQADEMERVAKAIEAGEEGLTLNMDLYSDMLDTVNRLTGQVEEIVFQGKEGLDFLNAMRQTRLIALKAAIQTGSLRVGSPIGYLSLLRSGEEHKVLNALFDNDELYRIVDTAMPTLGALMRRRADDVTLEDLNDLYQILTESSSPRAAEFRGMLDQVAKSLDLEGGFKAFEDRPTLLMLSRLATAERTKTSMGFLDEIFRDGAQSIRKGEGPHLAGGKVVGYVVAGEDEPVANLRAWYAKFDKGETGTTDIVQREITRPEIEGLVVELDNGQTIKITPDRLAQNGAILGLGSPNLEWMKADAELNGVTGSMTAAAFAQRVGRGGFSGGSMLEGDKVLRDGSALAGLEGQYIAFGNKDTLAGVLATMKGQWDHSHKIMRYIDNANFAMKRWITVLNPAFHVNNWAGTFAQAHVVGIPPRYTMLGMLDAIRFLSKSQEFAGRYDAFNTFVDEGRGFHTPSQEFLRVLRRNPKLPEGGREFYENGGRYYEEAELLEALRPIFGTATREGLRGGARVSQSLADTRTDALAKGVVAKIKNRAGAVLEGSEVVSRLAVFFAASRMGRTLTQAAEDTLKATVNYADLTTRERNVAKRVFGFYTFARKMTPTIYERYFAEPQYASAIGHTLTKSGLFKERDGQVYMDIPGTDGDWTVNIQRVVPQIEAIKWLEAYGVERLPRGAGAVGELFGGKGNAAAQVGRQQVVEGMSPQPFTLTPGLTATARLMSGEPEAAAKGVRDLFWPLRLMFGDADTFNEQTEIERVVETLTPLKKGHEKRRRVFLSARTRDLIRTLQRRASSTGDSEKRSLIRAEIDRLSDIARQLDQEIQK